ncbi:MAG TPA: serine/threonine-protein kinase, partial [Pirellulaceae bacterium]|nr:serine/threonine-protein kinase [Pirellulaceae bacterium]
MTPERHQQVKRLFLAAVELTPPDADRYLNEACGDDHALRHEVESLLSHHAEDTLLPARSRDARSTREFAELPTNKQMADSLRGTDDEPVAIRPPGTIIAGRYRLVAPLGRGGMGIVYRAEDLELNQTVALKFLSPRLKDFDGAMEMLRREVRIARQITHPNVVRVFDIGIADGDVFISMECVAGENLELLVRRVGRLTADKLLQIAWQLAAGLAAAHDAGILHRDLKPANVMIDGNGNVRILDFGIAAALDDRITLRTLAGTPGFVAPELLAGQSPSPRSDLYAWGLVVYYAATGNLPPLGKSGQQLPTEDLLRADRVEPELASFVGACLQTNPALRPRSAHELVMALSAGDPLRAAVAAGRVPPPDLLIASRSWQPSTRLLDGLLTGGLALLLLVTLLADRTLFLSRCGLAKSPDALQEIAEKTLVQLGWPAPQPPIATGVRLDNLCLQFIGQHAEFSDPWDKIHAGRFPAVFFSYRRGDPRLPRPSPLGEPDRDRLTQP